MYRIYTEKKDNLPILTSKYFDAFTLLPSHGYWRGKPEDGAVIEIETQEGFPVMELAREIKETNQQEAVLVAEFPSVSRLV